MIRATSCGVLYLFALCVSVASAQIDHNDPIQAHLDAQEFDQAVKRVEALPERNRLLGRIALAQAGAGDTTGSKETLRRITDVGELGRAATELRQGAKGGATGADFDTLINLITATVAPNSWDDVGGPGAIVEFPGGVYVDSLGVVRKTRLAIPSKRRLLDSALESARESAVDEGSRRSSDLRMVSLSRLQRELQLRATFEEEPTEAMKHLAGLRQIQYLFLFPETNDCVIAGPANDWSADSVSDDSLNDQSPAILLDDFVTLLRNVERADGRFGCSIAPKKANLAATKRFIARPTGPLKPHQTARWVGEIRDVLGLQDVVVHGIEPGSHVARILVEADYHMKLIGMGLEPSVPDVPSYLDSITADDIPTSLDVMRWWFTLRDQSIHKNEKGDAFVFAPQIVHLRSENEVVTDSGDRIHTGQSTALNQLFATRFTKHYDRLARQYPIYAKLDNLFRLSLVAALVQSDHVQSQVAWDPSWLISAVDTARGLEPREVPSIVNHRVIKRRHVVVGVSGGISANAKRAIKQIGSARHITDQLASDQQAATPRSPRSSERWWWD